MRRDNLMSADDVKYLVLHCSATRCNQDYTVEQLLRDHRARKFRKIGYHFYIRRDSTMTQHRMLLEVGAYAVPYRTTTISSVSAMREDWTRTDCPATPARRLKRSA